MSITSEGPEEASDFLPHIFDGVGDDPAWGEGNALPRHGTASLSMLDPETKDFRLKGSENPLTNDLRPKRLEDVGLPPAGEYRVGDPPLGEPPLGEPPVGDIPTGEPPVMDEPRTLLALQGMVTDITTVVGG